MTLLAFCIGATSAQSCKFNEYQNSTTGLCLKCENKLFGGYKCAENSSKELECQQCKYGMILATEPYNHCIEDCSTINARYVTNYITQSCEDCGLHGTQGNIISGGINSPLIGKAGFGILIT